MARLAPRTIIASLALLFCLAVGGCTPGGGGSASQPAGSTPAPALPASAPPVSASPSDDGY